MAVFTATRKTYYINHLIADVLDGLVSAFILAYLFDSLRKNVALARTLFFLNSGAGLVAFAYLTAAKGIVTGRDSGTKLLVVSPSGTGIDSRLTDPLARWRILLVCRRP